MRCMFDSRIRINSMSIIVVHPAPCRLGQYIKVTRINNLTYMTTGDGTGELAAKQTGTD